jgi:hypothetical protein
MTSQMDGAGADSIRANASIEPGAIHNPDAWLPGSKTGRKYFEPGAFGPDGGFFFVRNPTGTDLITSYGLLVREVGNVAPFSVVTSVYDANALAWWVLWRSSDEARRDPRMAGLAAYVPLNARGLSALRSGAFNARHPDLGFVSHPDENPVGLYLWGVVAHGLSDLIGKLVGHAIGLDVYEQLPMIGTIGTQQGLDALRRSTKSAIDASALNIGSTFEIRLPPKHIAHQREMRVWEGERERERVDILTPLQNSATSLPS